MTGPGNPGNEDPLGSAAEEAAKLLDALSAWGRAQSTAGAGSLTGALTGLLEMVSEIDTHVAGEDCRYCPVCRMIAAVRTTSPEVRAHLTEAAGSLVQASLGVFSAMEAKRARPDRPERSEDPEPHDRGFHKIDLDPPNG